MTKTEASKSAAERMKAIRADLRALMIESDALVAARDWAAAELIFARENELIEEHRNLRIAREAATGSAQ